MSKLTLTFNNDGTVDTSLDKDIDANVLLLGLTTVLAGFIEETAETAQLRDRAISVVCEKLRRGKTAEFRPAARDVQGILGTDWLDGKTPEELVREHREGRA
jgi:uncharacterized protein (DUF2336 family)